MNPTPRGPGFEGEEEPPILSDLRLEELLNRHDAIVSELSTPDPLLDAYAAGRDGQAESGASNRQKESPSKVSSLEEYRAHLKHAVHRERLRDELQRVLEVMVEEGMPVGVWILCGAGRYVRLERDPGPESQSLPSDVDEDEQDVNAPADVEPGHQGVDDEPTSGKHGDPKALRFYSVRKEALEGLSPEVPAADVNEVSQQIKHFEALPWLRRTGILYYPFLILICIASAWMLGLVLAPSLVTEIILASTVVVFLSIVAALHFDSGRVGPRAIREHKRQLTLAYGHDTEPLVMRYKAREEAARRSER